MSENLSTKLNLKALTQDIPPSSNTEDMTVVWAFTWETPVKQVETGGAKISLGMIKKNIDASQQGPSEIGNTVNKEGAIAPDLVWETHQEMPSWIKENTATGSSENWLIEIAQDNGDHAPSKELLQFLETEKKENEQQEKVEIAPVKESIKFDNYESWFKKQSGNLIKKIQNFRYTPKTRVGLLIALIALCVSTIASLMIFVPEKHSFEVYKASILDMVQNEPALPSPPPDVTNIIPTNTPLIGEDTWAITPEEIPEDTSLDTTDTHSGNSQDKKEILRQHLLKKYSSL